MHDERVHENKIPGLANDLSCLWWQRKGVLHLRSLPNLPHLLAAVIGAVPDRELLSLYRFKHLLYTPRVEVLMGDSSGPLAAQLLGHHSMAAGDHDCTTAASTTVR